MAAPGRAFWDVAIAAQEWAPLHAPRRDWIIRETLTVSRLGMLASACGVGADEAPELVDVIFAERAQSVSYLRGEIAAGSPVWVGHWQQRCGEERAAADDAWLELHRQALVDAIGGRARSRP
jgi:hypothetical protein